VSAREQAREAAIERVNEYAGDAADAASDVWEPIVRELLEAIDRETLTGSGRSWWTTTRVTYQKAKEALGG
jgi:hypothetical protein